MPNFSIEIPIDADASLAWEIWSDFQNFDRILPIKIQGGTDSNEPGAVRIFEMNSSIVVERLENRDEQLKQQIVSALTHFLPIQNLVTSTKILEKESGVILSFEQSYLSCSLSVETTEEILTGICQTVAGALEGAAKRKKEGIEAETHESPPLNINRPAPEFCLQDQHGKEHSLADHRGKWLLLACYFADETFA